MKKLTVLMAIILIAGLLSGCWLFPESKLDYIKAKPDKVTLTMLTMDSLIGITQQLEVTAFYEDLTEADVTLECDYAPLTVSNTEVVTVNDKGLITAKGKGKAEILVSYTQRNFLTSNIIRTCKVKILVN
ncbi:hypothetical protein ES695_11195 [Candidatus Atribacteria bacterium 1244-E10-H5-B2]|nr:MAG: hypothetical protein ES695_11195 [Candidatus Atribacteria bacterium 1244-E10-H5-B2]